jgi:hypothetical protein
MRIRLIQIVVEGSPARHAQLQQVGMVVLMVVFHSPFQSGQQF